MIPRTGKVTKTNTQLMVLIGLRFSKTIKMAMKTTVIKYKTIILLLAISAFAVATYARADLKTLMEMGRNQAAINKALTKETRN